MGRSSRGECALNSCSRAVKLRGGHQSINGFDKFSRLKLSPTVVVDGAREANRPNVAKDCRNPARILDVWAIRDLEVEMGFVSITGEPDLPENLAALDVVALLHADTAIHEVSVRGVFPVLVCDDHLVPARAVRSVGRRNGLEY